jgi:hypothetical protein
VDRFVEQFAGVEIVAPAEVQIARLRGGCEWHGAASYPERRADETANSLVPGHLP